MPENLIDCKVLVIDDNTYLLDLIALILLNEGIECKTLDNTQNIFEEINKFNPDVLLLDVSMPEADGRDICRQIKKNAQYFTLPIILISGSPLDAESLADACADNFIQKPFENKELVKMILSYNNLSRKMI